jgi:hypothetical protein
MALELNFPHEYVKKEEGKIPIYKEFCGKNIEQMPKLIAEGRVPMNVAQLMQRRLEIRNSSEKIKTAWLDNFFDTGDAVAHHPCGETIVDLDSQRLREMTPYSNTERGVLILAEDVYRTLKGERFKKEELGKIHYWMSKSEAKEHPFWKILARDQRLLNDYVDFIFTGKLKNGDEISAMAVSLGSCLWNKPEMKPLIVKWLDGSCVGEDVVSNGECRLIGILKEFL